MVANVHKCLPVIDNIDKLIHGSSEELVLRHCKTSKWVTNGMPQNYCWVNFAL